MKRTLLFFMMALAAKLGAWAQYEYSTLVVETKSGDTFEISLSKKPQVIFGVKELTFTCGEEVTGYVYDEVRKLHFKPYDPTGIAAVEEECVIRIECIDQSRVVISGVDSSDQVKLYALDGRSIAAVAETTDKVLTVSLNELTPGTYILNIGNKQSFKLLRR